MREIELKPDELLDLSHDMLVKGSHISFKARGRSMCPFIQDRDVLDIEAVRASDLKIGEVVFFRSPGNRPTVHRLVGRRMFDGRMLLIMQGDALSYADAPVREDEVLGKVTKIQRGEKTLILDSVRPWTVPLRIRLCLAGRLPASISSSCRRIAVSLLTGLQGIKPYRLLIRRLIGNKVLYRLAGSDDARGLSKFYGYRRFPELGDPVEAFSGHIESLAGRGCIVIAEVMGTIAGAVVISESPWEPPLDPDWWLSAMLVRARYRGAGIGKGLVLKALGKSYEDGHKRVSLLVATHNRTAVNLYLKMGFKPSLVQYKDIEHEKSHITKDFVLLSKTIGPLKNSPLDKEISG